MAPRRLTNNGAQSTHEQIGLDIGYGYTKAVAKHDSVLFPSVAMHGRELEFQADKIAQTHPNEQLWDEDGLWFVGTLAQSQGKAAEQIVLRGRTEDEASFGHAFRLRMLKAALAKLYPRATDVLHVSVSTGLPVTHMGGAAALKEALRGQHRIQTELADFVANVTDVIVMPQPYGTLYGHQLTERGELDKCYTFTRTAVMDAGTYTLDLAYDDDGEYIAANSGSKEAGVHLAHEIIRTEANKRLNKIIRVSDCEEALRTGCIRHGRTAHDFTEARAQAIRVLSDAALSLIGEKLSTALVDVLYITGGGAELIYPAIRQSYDYAELVESSQLANARGYLNFALFKANG